MHTHKMMTTRQVAERLGVDRSWVVRLVASGQLSAADTVDGGTRTAAYLFDPVEVERFAAARAAASDDTPPHGIARPDSPSVVAS